MNANVKDRMKKDKIARDFIEQVNPYGKKPSLGIDLRALLIMRRIKLCMTEKRIDTPY